jgi:hypothetical protein
MKRNPVVRDLIAKPRRNAGKHASKHNDKRAVMIEDLTNVRAELEQEMRELIESMIDKKEKQEEIIADLYQLLELVQKVKDTESELTGYEP